MKIVSYKGFLYESEKIANNLIVVDIQPEYSRFFNFRISDFIRYINDNISKYDNVLFLYNGPELGFPEKAEYINWLLENGLNEDVLESISFYDKGYNFFRHPIDSGIDREETINLVKYMLDNRYNDSRDLDKEDIDSFLELHPNSVEIAELMFESDDPLTIPDLMDELKDLSGSIIVCGGGRYECLEEVLIGLDVLDKKYSLLEKFVY